MRPCTPLQIDAIILRDNDITEVQMHELLVMPTQEDEVHSGAGSSSPPLPPAATIAGAASTYATGLPQMPGAPDP